MNYIVVYGGAHGTAGQTVRLDNETAAPLLRRGFIIAAPEEPKPKPRPSASQRKATPT